MSKPINRIITGQHPIITMRRAKLVDVPVLQTLIEHSLRDAAEGHYTPRQLESALHSIAQVDTDLIDDGKLHVVVSGGEIVGVGGWSARGARWRGDLEASLDEDVDKAATPAYVHSFFVNTHWTRMGIAAQLLAECVAQMKRAGFQQMVVLATPMSLSFFKVQGFGSPEPAEIPLPDGLKLPVTRLVKSLGEAG